MPSSQLLQHLPIGQPIDSVRLAVVRESAYAAQAWYEGISTPATSVIDVLNAEQQLTRQIGALGILGDAKLYRQLHARISDGQQELGSTFVAAFVLLQHDRAASESPLFVQWWRSEPGRVRQALGLALALCGIRSREHTTTLARALGSSDADAVQHAAALVTRLGPLCAWPVPAMGQTAGLCAALELMRAGAIAPVPAALRRAAEHADVAVRQAGRRTHQILAPQAALAQCRHRVHQGHEHDPAALELLGLLHDKDDPSAPRDMALLRALSTQPHAAKAALNALGLTGCGQAANACLKAAERDPQLAWEAARSLRAIFGFDDEFWAPFAGETGELEPDVLQAAYQASLSEAPSATLSDFQPRSLSGLMTRLRYGDMAHLHARAQECQMRSGGRARLHPWAYLTTQLGPSAPLAKQTAAIEALASCPEALAPRPQARWEQR